MVGLWFEPDVIRGTLEMFPEMMKMAPDLTDDAAALDSNMKAIGATTADKNAD